MAELTSVTRFGEISDLYHNVKTIWPFWKGSISICQSYELTLAKFKCYWANSHCWKWQNIKNNLAIWSHYHWLVYFVSYDQGPKTISSNRYTTLSIPCSFCLESHSKRERFILEDILSGLCRKGLAYRANYSSTKMEFKLLKLTEIWQWNGQNWTI